MEDARLDMHNCRLQTIPPSIRRLSNHFEGGELLNHTEHDYIHLVANPIGLLLTPQVYFSILSQSTLNVPWTMKTKIHLYIIMLRKWPVWILKMTKLERQIPLGLTITISNV